MTKSSGNGQPTSLSGLEKSSAQNFAVMAWGSAARVLRNEQRAAHDISFSTIPQTRSSSNVFRAWWTRIRLQMNTRYTCIRGYMFLSLACVKQMPRVTDASLEARLRKIGDVSDSDLVEVSACGCEGSAEGGWSPGASTSWWTGCDSCSVTLWASSYSKRNLEWGELCLGVPYSNKAAIFLSGFDYRYCLIKESQHLISNIDKGQHYSMSIQRLTFLQQSSSWESLHAIFAVDKFCQF